MIAKKHILLMQFLILGGTLMYADDEYNHSFYTMRPIYELVSPLKRSCFHTNRLNHNDGIDTDNNDGGYTYGDRRRCLPCAGRCDPDKIYRSSLQSVFFGGSSISPAELNKYFMKYPFGALTSIEYTAAAPSDPQSKELEARNFNIVTQDPTQPFKSVIEFRPEYRTWGIGFTWLGQIIDRPSGDALLWIEISAPLQAVYQRMAMAEVVVNTGGGAEQTIGLDNTPHVANMTKAFKQEGWNFSKIPSQCALQAFGLADIEATIGYNAVQGSGCALDVYGGLKIPTGTRINAHHAQYLFNPVIGNNHHWGIELGTHIDYSIFLYKGHHIQMQFDAEFLFLFPNTQWRSFDLVQQGGWSRFLEVYKNLASAQAAATDPSPLNMNVGTSGINIFTKPLRIHPRMVLNTNNGLVYTYHGFDLEVGWNAYFKQAEHATLICWDEEVAVKDVQGSGQTNLAKRIGRNFTQEALPVTDYRIITTADLNIHTAEHPAVLSSMLYLAGSYTTRSSVPVLIGLGGLYEWSSSNSNIQRWFAFGKLAIAF